MRLEHQQGGSQKFWEIDLDDASFTVRFGRIGTKGQSQTKTFASAEEARAEHDALVREKLRKGYAQAGGAAAPAAPPAPPAPAPAAEPEEPALAMPALEVASARADAPAEEPLPRLRFSEAARRRIEPSRANAPAPARLDVPRLWKKVAGGWRAHAAAWEAGLERATPEVAQLTREAVASLAGEAPSGLDPEREAVRAVVAGASSATMHNADRPELKSNPWNWKDDGVGEALVGFWVAREGVAFALEALVRSGQYRRMILPQPSERVWLEHRPKGRPSFGSAREAWVALRRHLASAPGEDYQAARERARARRSEGSYRFRAALAYAFPDEPGWAAETAREWLAEDQRSRAEGKGALRPESSTLYSLRDVELLDKLLDERWVSHGVDADILLTALAHTGTALLPALLRLARLARSARDRAAVVEALAAVEAEEVAALMAGWVDEREEEVRGPATDYLKRVPDLALPALLASSGGRGPTGPAASLIEFVARAHPAAVERAWREEPTWRPLLEKLRSEVAAEVPEAPADEVPAVLARPPWVQAAAAPRAKSKPRVVSGRALLPYEERVPMTDEVREPLLAASARLRALYSPTPEQQEVVIQNVRAACASRPLQAFASADAVPDEVAWELLEKTRGLKVQYFTGSGVSTLYARFGLRAFELILSLELDTTSAATSLFAVDSPRVAPFMARALALKKLRADAEGWLLQYPRAAAIGLVPLAVGPRGKDRQAAAEALQVLAAKGQAAVIREVAAAYGSDAAEAVEDTLAVAGEQPPAARPPALPAFWNAAGLPRPRLPGGTRALPVEAVETLGGLLALSSLEAPHPALAAARAALDARSLGEFSWALFEAWMGAGAPMKEQWAFHALGLLGDDIAARKLGGLIREWPAQGNHARAVLGLEVLGAIGTDLALMAVHGIAQRARHAGIQKKAGEVIARIAEARGLTSEELADRLVPDLDLDADGSRRLDFGPRQFVVGFDEHLEPFVRDAAGKRLGELPKPGKADDAAKAKAAVETWKTLKKDVKAVAREQLLRLELALCQERRWPLATFREHLVAHPLLGHLVRRLVFSAHDASGATVGTFRVAEDGSFADAEDRAFAPAEGVQVSLLHPLLAEAELLGRWSRVLADYEVLQPFPQLGREVYRPTHAERDARSLERVRGWTASAGRLLGLEARGWRRGRPGNSGVVSTMDKPLPGGSAELHFEEGWIVGEPSGEHRLQEVALAGAASFGALPPVAFSELVRDLETLRS